MSRYIQLQDVKDYIGFTGTIGQLQDGLIQDCINRAESAIDSYTRRNFAGTAGTYYVNRFGQDKVVSRSLYLSRDLHTLVGVTNGDGQSIPVGSVWTEPRNDGPPYRILRLHSAYVYVWSTDNDVIISGTFGYGTVAPQDIQQATVRYATYLYRGKDNGFGANDVTGFPEGGEVPVVQGIPQDVRYLLAPYRSRSGGVV